MTTICATPPPQFTSAWSSHAACASHPMSRSNKPGLPAQFRVQWHGKDTYILPPTTFEPSEEHEESALDGRLFKLELHCPTCHCPTCMCSHEGGGLLATVPSRRPSFANLYFSMKKKSGTGRYRYPRGFAQNICRNACTSFLPWKVQKKPRQPCRYYNLQYMYRDALSSIASARES